MAGIIIKIPLLNIFFLNVFRTLSRTGETYGQMQQRIPLFATKYNKMEIHVLRGKRSVGEVDWMSI